MMTGFLDALDHLLFFKALDVQLMEVRRAIVECLGMH